MRIYKPTYRGRDGQVRESAKFYCELRTADGRVLRLPGFTNQRMTESLGRNVERLIECRASGDTLPQDTTRWIETLPIQTTKVLGRWGLLQGHTLAAGKALTEHLTDWLSYMRAKSLTERHATTMHHHALRIFTACKAKFLSDIRPAKVQVAIAAGKDAGLSLQTCNHLAMAVKAFTHWACRDGRLQTDPLAHLTKYNAALDKRHSRRALSPTEAQAIIQAAESGPTILGMDGHGRAVLYHTAYGTGFRANELRSLTPENFNLDGEPPTITVRAGFSKHRREDIQPIRHDLADMLRKYLAGKPAGTPVFDMPEKTYKLMRADCGAAGVAYCDDAGQYADFHAWRHSFISALAKANVSVKLAQTLARHSDPKLTLNTYTHIGLFDTSAALETLPGMTLPQAEKQTAAALKTGTDDQPVKAAAESTQRAIPEGERRWARHWAREDTKPWNSVEPDGVLAMPGHDEENPPSMRETCDNQGDYKSAPDRDRTCDLRFRKPPLYPTELRAPVRGILGQAPGWNYNHLSGYCPKPVKGQARKRKGTGTTTGWARVPETRSSRSCDRASPKRNPSRGTRVPWGDCVMNRRSRSEVCKFKEPSPTRLTPGLLKEMGLKRTILLLMK